MPDTAVLMGVTDPFDVEQNIAGGVRFLSNCLKKFDANIVLALAAYNAGPENVVKYKGCPPFPETEDYVAKVIKGYNGKIWVKGLDKQVWVEIEEGEAGKPGDDGLDWKIDRARFLISSPQWKIPLPNAKLLAAGKKIKAGVCARPPLAVGNIKPQVKKSKQAAGEGNLL
jgi:hypothetical protein